VRLLEVDSGETRVLDARATGMARAGSTLLVYGGDKLRGYRLDGRQRFALLEGTDTGYVQTAGRYAYVGTRNSTRFAIVDIQAGRVVGNASTAKPVAILDP
jgi:hypothetical protein